MFEYTRPTAINMAGCCLGWAGTSSTGSHMQLVSGAGVNDVHKQGMLGFGRKPSPSALPDACLHTVAVSPIKHSSMLQMTRTNANDNALLIIYVLV